MVDPTPRVVLTMIVKDEAHVIRRCIDSMRPVIDAYCIVDTGSTDGTGDAIREAAGDLPGEVHVRPWVDFGHNRSEALELARPLGDWSIMIDADVVAGYEPTFDSLAFRRGLTDDVYRITFRDGIEYQRPLVTRTSLPFRYRGVLHEFLEVPDGAIDGGVLTGLWYRSTTDGASWQQPDKYRRDSGTIFDALHSGEDPELSPRYLFYMAQSLRDADDVVAAADCYRARAQLGGWSEEVYVAWLWHARMLRRMGRSLGEVVDPLLLAQEALPGRAEAWCQAAAWAREEGRHQTSFVFARRALEVDRPADGLFLEPDVYEWRALYEYSIAAFYAGDNAGGLRACHRLLFQDKLPRAEREATERNLEHYPAEAIAVLD